MSKPAVAPTIAWCTRGTVLGGQDGHRHLEWPYPRRCVLPIIGSGWLFGALYASQQAGAAALIAWGVGAVFMLTLALIHAELGGAYPVAGGTARFPHYSHGSMTGYAIGWLWWLGAVTVAPIEVEAALQYFTHYLSWLTTTSGGETVLTAQGYGAAVLLMALFTFVNIMGVRWLAKANTPITAWKIAIAASAGSPFSSISTLRSRPAAPGCSTRARARALRTRSVGTADRLPRLDLRNAIWLPPYLVGVAVISYNRRYDGRNLIPFWWDLALVAVFSIVIFVLAVAVRLPAEEAQEYIANLDPMLEEPELDAADQALTRAP
jgi:amino acid transporter